MTLDDLVKTINKKPTSKKDLATKLNLSQAKVDCLISDLVTKGYDILSFKSNGNIYYQLNKSGFNDSSYELFNDQKLKSTNRKWLEISDIHAGCKHFDKSGLEEILTIAEGDGYKDVHISGDLVDGYDVYNGQLINLTKITEPEQADLLSEILSKYKLNYYAISGNHDDSWTKRLSPNPLALIEKNVPNFKYLKGSTADLLFNGIAKRMVHGSGSNAYGKSYKGQVYLRNLLDSIGGLDVIVEKSKYPLKFLQIGHYHSGILYESAGVQVSQPLSFQKPNDYTIKKGLVGKRGGILVDTTLEDKEITSYIPRFIYVS
jgi:biotin operon repressor